MASIFKSKALAFMSPYKLSLAQKLFLAPYLSVKGFIDPNDGSHIAGLGEATGEFAAKCIYDKLKATKDGQALLKERPLISKDKIRFDKLKILENGTLGIFFTFN